MPKRDNTKTLEPIEVLVVVLLCVFAVAATAPVLLASRTDAYRMQCAGNLSQIGKAMLIYANDYDDVFPRSGGRSGTWDRVISNWRAANRFTAYGMTASGEAGRASISSCFYLLVKYGDVSPGTFVCPGDSGTTEFILANAGAGDRDLTDLWDFGREAYKHCSYSYHMPFGLFALTTSSDPGMAIAADRNPWIDSPAGRAKDISMFVPRGNRAAAKHGNALAVDLSEATEPYQVVLARMRRQSTLGRSVATAEEMISRFKADPDYQVLREFRSIDTLIVPDILYKLTHNFTELEGRPLAHAQWPGYFILEAMQMVDFSLSKTGVILRSESRMTVPPFAVRRGQVVESRHFHFDSPFLIYVKKRGRDHSPFFAMWVDNAELMQ